MTKIYQYKIPIYYGTLVIIIGELIEIPEKWKPKEFDSFGYEAITYSRQINSGYKYFCIAFPEWSNQKSRVHEAFHCVNWIFDSKGISYDVKNDEHAAYLLGWIFEKVEESLKKYRKI